MSRFYIKTLRDHNAWRRGENPEMQDPTSIGLAIDRVCVAAERYEFVRTLPPVEFQKIYAANLAGAGSFDSLVDTAIEVRKISKIDRSAS